MPRTKTASEEVLKYRLETRVTEKKYLELKAILAGNKNKVMSSLLRDFLNNKAVKVYTRDQTLDNLMEELSRLRTEIKAIGININQITRMFNSYPQQRRREFYAKTAFDRYQKIEPKIDDLLLIVSKLAHKWLQE